MRALWCPAIIGILITSGSEALASNAKADLIITIQKTEDTLRTTRWHFNNQAHRQKLRRELVVLERIYDRVIAYEGEINGFPCAGATINPSGGPPSSTAASDAWGWLAQRRLTGAGRPIRQAIPSPSSLTGGEGARVPPRAGRPGLRRGFGSLRRITDVEVQLISMIVILEDRINGSIWNFSTVVDKKALQEEAETLKRTLRRVRNGNC